MQIIFTLLLLMSIEPSFAESKKNAPVSSFEAGRRAYENGKFKRALDLLAQAIAAATDSSNRNKAYYFQGLTLFELGHYYSSYLSFRNVLLTADDSNREIYEKAIKNAIIITDRLGMVDRVGRALANLPINFIPTTIAPLTHYALGIHYADSNEVDRALSHLKSVTPDSPYYQKALFNLGILSTKKKDHKESVYYFEKLLEQVKGKRELFPVAELARLNLARSLYTIGNLDRSIEVFSQFMSSSPYWLTVLLEASWPLMRVNDTTVSLGNLHTVLSPFYREDLVGEGYILRATILFTLCKYEEMRRTLAQFFLVYDPIVKAMQAETTKFGSADAMYLAYTSQGLSPAFRNFVKRDAGLINMKKVMELLRDERRSIAKYKRNEQMKRMSQLIEETEKAIANDMGAIILRLHKRKLEELLSQREQANYLKVEIVTGEKELIEGQKGLPPKRLVDVETNVAEDYHFWPYQGEYWEDELGAYVYTTESACVK